MILKARFTANIDTLNQWLTKYQTINGPVHFFTESAFGSNSVIIGKNNEIMFFIGFVAGLGENCLEIVSKA
jgi:hypothetical protein